jgi:hypothetical protein
MRRRWWRMMSPSTLHINHHNGITATTSRCTKSFHALYVDQIGKVWEVVTLIMALIVIPHSEIAGTKPPYVCPGYFIHTYSNNMINRFHVQKYKYFIHYRMTLGSKENYINAAAN